jgi:hypothetical protein
MKCDFDLVASQGPQRAQLVLAAGIRLEPTERAFRPVWAHGAPDPNNLQRVTAAEEPELFVHVSNIFRAGWWALPRGHGRAMEMEIELLMRAKAG